MPRRFLAASHAVEIAFQALGATRRPAAAWLLPGFGPPFMPSRVEDGGLLCPLLLVDPSAHAVASGGRAHADSPPVSQADTAHVRNRNPTRLGKRGHGLSDCRGPAERCCRHRVARVAGCRTATPPYLRAVER